MKVICIQKKSNPNLTKDKEYEAIMCGGVYEITDDNGDKQLLRKKKIYTKGCFER